MTEQNCQQAYRDFVIAMAEIEQWYITRKAIGEDWRKRWMLRRECVRGRNEKSNNCK